MIVSAAEPLGDVVCPHCGSLCFPNVLRPIETSDDEFKLSQKGLFVETNDEGDIVLLYLRGIEFNDKSIDKIAKYGDVPAIDVTLTAISSNGVKKLQEILPNTRILRSQ